MSQANHQFHQDICHLKPWLFLALHYLLQYHLQSLHWPMETGILLFVQNRAGSPEHDAITDRDLEFKMTTLTSLCNIGKPVMVSRHVHSLNPLMHVHQKAHSKHRGD